MFKRKSVNVAALIALGVAAPVLAQQTAPAQPAQQLERVEVTGSSIKRINAETALPITVITRAEIAKSGVRTTEELVSQVTSVSSAGGQVNAGQSGLATYGLSAVSMRGLGSNRTLVLVNGRRLAVFAGSGASVNVNAIPLAAVERVEVLQDGASGVYGSDAIAGVMNFILRKDFKGFEVSAEYGEPTRGGGAKAEKFGVVGGFGSYERDGFSLTASLSAEKEGALLGSARDFSKSDTRLPFYAGGGTETGRIEGAWDFPGQATLTGAGANGRSATNPFGISGTGYGNPLAASNQCAVIGMVPRSGLGFTQGFTPAADGSDAAARNGKNCGFDTGPFVGLVPKRDYLGATAGVRFKLSPDAELFGEGMFSKNEFTNAIQPAPLRQAFYAGNTRFQGSGVDPALLIFPSNPNYQTAATYLNSVGLGAMVGRPLAVSQRTFLIGPRTTNDKAEQTRLVAGVRGSLSDKTDYELGYTYNRSVTNGTVIDGFASIFELSKLLNNPASNWNPWAPLGQQSPALTAQIREKASYVGPTIDSKSLNSGIDAKISTSLMELGGGALGVAAGLNARDERYVLTPAAATLTGDVIGLGGAIQPVNARRNVWAMFTEVNAPFTKELEANLAVRQDNYSDFGRTNNAKVSLRFQPMRSLLVRGSVGTGFRAPTLVDLYTPEQLNTTEQFTDPLFPGNGQIQVTSIGGGNTKLGPEKSDQASLGLVFQPFQNLTMSLDLFSVKIDGPIVAPSAQALVAAYRRGDPGSAAFVTVTASNEIDTVVQKLVNVGSIKTSGADVDVRFRENVGPGRLDIGLNGTYVSKYDLVNPAGQLEKSVGTIVRPDGAPLVAAATGVILRWKHNLSVGYTWGPLSTTLTQRFYRGYETAADLNGDRFFVKSQSTYDLVTSYDVKKDLRLTLGVRNLLDRDPPLFINNGSQFQAGYDVYQEDPRGRFIYLNASYRF